MFGDTVDEGLPEFQQNLGLKVNQSNLCSEITLATDKDRTAVCCLSSVNLEEYDEWKDSDQFIPDLVRMLDNVLQYFIDHAPDQLSRAKYSAMRERSIGLGAMGFHAYLQRHNTPFESAMAKSRNMQMFSRIKSEAERATRDLAKERGECPDGEGYGVRNAHLLAVAPNASSSIICGNTSPSIFPANVSKQELHAIHIMAWKRGVKTLYYLRSEAYKRAETISDEVLRARIFESIDDDGCLACEG
jgi:ribonucleoside-diphosphate reductase alpha chain